ncbi:MAG: sugar transferase [Myxococcales bacterium]|nr:sugar transferase [Myxococcales bacterium]MBK7197393.1 sugar transferase [Myxococcales bacterium]
MGLFASFRDLRQRAVKRAFDVLGASAAIVVTSPVVALAAAATRVEVGPPPFARVLRAGRGAEPFAMWHLRTHDQTELGAWLRATGIAALPALWNVVAGEMSLVGPRPVHPQYAALSPINRRTKPGLTGWSQLHGGADRAWDDEQALDRWYADHASLTVDALIVLRAVRDRLRKRDAAAPSAPEADPSRGPGRPAAILN